MPGLYVRTVEANRKSCPHCKARLGQGERVWAAGVYVGGKWRNAVDRFCRDCWKYHRRQYDGKVYDLRSRHDPVPYWLHLPGQSVLTPDQVSLCRSLSAFLPGPVCLVWGDGGIDVGTHAVRFPTDAWFRTDETGKQTCCHPVTDWCDENHVGWSWSEETVTNTFNVHDSAEYVTKKTGFVRVWFHLPADEAACQSV